jgi:hypothetical protein
LIFSRTVFTAGDSPFKRFAHNRPELEPELSLSGIPETSEARLETEWVTAGSAEFPSQNCILLQEYSFISRRIQVKPSEIRHPTG